MIDRLDSINVTFQKRLIIKIHWISGVRIIEDIYFFKDEGIIKLDSYLELFLNWNPSIEYTRAGGDPLRDLYQGLSSAP
jgi:hypothetical protein